MVFFILTGFYFWENAKNQTLAIAYFTSALFINPIFKIALGRTLWNIIDVIWVIFIIVTLKNHLNDTN